jgi:Mrp family chromosome partitioning ATPase
LAAALRRWEYLVGILDADITGPSIPMMFGANQMPIAGSQGWFDFLKNHSIAGAFTVILRDRIAGSCINRRTICG